MRERKLDLQTRFHIGRVRWLLGRAWRLRAWVQCLSGRRPLGASIVVSKGLHWERQVGGWWSARWAVLYAPFAHADVGRLRRASDGDGDSDNGGDDDDDDDNNKDDRTARQDGMGGEEEDEARVGEARRGSVRK